MVLKQSRDEIKAELINTKQDGPQQLILVAMSIVIKFFENLKKFMKKAENLNLGPAQLGHLIPLTVGHRDRPTDREDKYIKSVMKLANFNYVPIKKPFVPPSNRNLDLPPSGLLSPEVQQ